LDGGRPVYRAAFIRLSLEFDSDRDEYVSNPSGGQRGQRGGSSGRRASGSGSGKPAARGKRPVGDRDGATPKRAAPDRARGKQSTDRGKQGTTGRDRQGAAAGRDRGKQGATSRDTRAGTGRPARAEVRTRAERIPRGEEPALPDGLDLTMLDRSVRAELRTLSKANAEIVGGHLIAAGFAVDTDPKRALAHARAARARASRLAVVREAVGVAAYHAEEWAEALTELRTARRISGDPRNLPLLADCERALGRPAQAVRMLTDPDVRRLDPEARAELLIVVAGARRDLGQLDAALAVLARGGLDRERPRPGSVRLWYAYADVLEALDRTEDAATWFAASAALDVEGDTDAAERAAALL
jgi:hypothetical protein